MRAFTQTCRPVSRAALDQSIADIAREYTSLLWAGDQPSIAVPPAAALFFTHLCRVSADSKHRALAIEAARLSGDLIAHVPLGPQLYGGLAGVAWPLAHLERLGITDDAFDLGNVDDLLIECVSDAVTPHFDLISGTVGLGIYFLERLPTRPAIEGLRKVIQRLEDTGESDDSGLRWLTSPEFVPPTQRGDFPAGKYDLGLAHGVPGVIAFLAIALMNGADRQPTEGMLRAAVKWLVALERPDTSRGAYGVVIDARKPKTPLRRRAAWCYGDPGIAIALLLAAQALRDSNLRHRAHRLARGAAVLAEEERDSVVDTSLCHGSAGLAHLFGILGDALDDEELRARSDAWHATTIELRRPGEGIAGYYFSKWDNGNRRRVADPTVLQGAAGVGLSLLSALDPNSDRSWDRLLLLS